MSDWPKKMKAWYSPPLKRFRADEDPVVHMDCLDVIVYPADQAPELVAWIGPVGQLMLNQIYRDWSAAYPNSEAPGTFKPLYLAPPSESAIRASEREWCAECVDSLGHEYDCPDIGKIAAAIRELGDE